MIAKGRSPLLGDPRFGGHHRCRTGSEQRQPGGTLTGDRLGAGQQAMARAGAEAAGGSTDGERAAIVVVGRDAGELEALSGELSKRYGADYSIVVCDTFAELGMRMRELIAAGPPVAMVIGG